MCFHNRIKNKCKEAYLYVTTVSNRIQNYLDPYCSSRALVAMDMKLFPDSDEIENTILLLYWHAQKRPTVTRFKEGFNGRHWAWPLSVDLTVCRIRRHLAESPSFGEQTADAGGTPRQTYLTSKRWTLR